MDNECITCEYYDSENDVCAAFLCDILNCDTPLPCEVDHE